MELDLVALIIGALIGLLVGVALGLVIAGSRILNFMRQIEEMIQPLVKTFTGGGGGGGASPFPKNIWGVLGMVASNPQMLQGIMGALTGKKGA